MLFSEQGVTMLGTVLKSKIKRSKLILLYCELLLQSGNNLFTKQHFPTNNRLKNDLGQRLGEHDVQLMKYILLLINLLKKKQNKKTGKTEKD